VNERLDDLRGFPGIEGELLKPDARVGRQAVRAWDRSQQSLHWQKYIPTDLAARDKLSLSERQLVRCGAFVREYLRVNAVEETYLTSHLF
jgi:hypothetical protein